MSNPTSTSIPSNPFAAFTALDPMAFWSQSQQAMQGCVDHYAQLEAQFVARAQLAVATMAQLAQDTIAYAAQLSAQARKTAHEMTTAA